MPPKSSHVINSYTSIQAVKKSAEEKSKKDGKGRAVSNEQHPAAPPKVKPVGQSSNDARFAHTAKPTLHQIECYACGYTYNVRGSLASIICPKCKVSLDVKDYIINSEKIKDIATVGVVEINTAGIIKDSSIKANTIVLKGKLINSTAFANVSVEIFGGAEFDIDKIDTNNLIIGEGNSILSLKEELKHKNIEIRGKMKANIVSSGTVKIVSTGFFIGSIKAKTLIIEDGAGLLADLEIG
ncbi:MAG: polymer-forming cytoskeletal protein [Kiritimatiellae bacterium]|jgi:cytoskeletal protein CcmA (bactofilin family)|nr:polymer-forming cytoskeletal protein [Kiritimatiellia bacterium]